MGAAAGRCEPDVAGARLRVRVVPRARSSALVGWHGDAVKVRLAAPPVDGKANAALLSTLATAVGVDVRDLRVVAGARGRDKVVEVAGLSREALAARLRAALPSR